MSGKQIENLGYVATVEPEKKKLDNFVLMTFFGRNDLYRLKLDITLSI